MERDAILAVLRDIPEIQFAYLFGSRAGDRARADSDWDIAVYLDEALTSAERFKFIGRIVSAMPLAMDVDLVILNDAPPLLAHRALQGEQLFVRDRDLFAEVFVKVLGQSMDEAYYRDIHRQARNRRLVEGRFGRP